MNIAAGGIVAIETGAASAAHHGAGLLGRQLLATLPHGIFFRGSIAIMAPFPEIGLCKCWQDPPPCSFEVCARLVEIDGGIAPVAARFDAGIEAATPFPLIDVDRAAGAAGDRADMDIAVIDVPAIGTLGVAAAGEFGHGP